MTPTQLYEKMDQVANATHYSPTERSEALAALLKIAYDENIPFPVLTTDSGTHPAYFVLDNENPMTIGNRFLICFTSMRKADLTLKGADTTLQGADTGLRKLLSILWRADTRGFGRADTSRFGPDVQKGYALPRPFLNNVFNKRIIGGLVFNPEPKNCIVVPKRMLEAAIPGYHPKPEGFVDVEVEGYPKNMPDEWM